MSRFRKVYLEISNICNLRCAFCPGTQREKHIMGEDVFRQLALKLRPCTDFLYFHLMGEPLLHPRLASYLQIAAEFGFRVIITTNGTLLREQQAVLLGAQALHKINISLHAFEANDLNVPFSDYLQDCIRFGKAAEGKKLTVFRLWNRGGQDEKNDQILNALEKHFPTPWVAEPRGTRIGNRVYLEYGDKFEWPDLKSEEHGTEGFCYALRDHIGVLCDGSVVPCCLDHNGDLILGNLLQQDLQEILESDRAKRIYNGFSERTASEELCRKCGYARRFIK